MCSKPLLEKDCGEEGSEESLALENYRREARGRAQFYCGKKKAKLADAQEKAVGRNKLHGRRWPLDEEDCGQSAKEEAQCREHEGRHGRDPHFDDDEVEAPDRCDQHSQK